MKTQRPIPATPGRTPREGARGWTTAPAAVPAAGRPLGPLYAAFALAVAALLAVAAAIGATPARAEASPTSSAGDVTVKSCDGGEVKLNSAEYESLQDHNKARTSAGLDYLCVSPTLTRVARAHSSDMLQNNYFPTDTPSSAPSSASPPAPSVDPSASPSVDTPADTASPGDGGPSTSTSVTHITGGSTSDGTSDGGSGDGSQTSIVVNGQQISPSEPDAVKIDRSAESAGDVGKSLDDTQKRVCEELGKARQHAVGSLLAQANDERDPLAAKIKQQVADQFAATFKPPENCGFTPEKTPQGTLQGAGSQGSNDQNDPGVTDNGGSGRADGATDGSTEGAGSGPGASAPPSGDEISSQVMGMLDGLGR